MPGWITKHTGGSELQAYLLSEQLINRGWKVEVLTSTNRSKNLNKTYYNNSISYFYYPPRLFKSFFISWVYLLLKSYKHISSEIIYLRTNSKLLISSLRLIAKIKRKKLVYAIASDQEITGHYHNNKYNNNLLNLWTRVQYWIINKISPYDIIGLKHVIAQTKTQQSYLLNSLGVRSKIISNSIPNELLLKQNFIKKENIILWVGNMRKVKQPEYFVQLAQKISNKNYRFIMIGDYSKYEHLKKGSNNIVEFLGQIEAEEVQRWIAKSLLLVNTSKYEGFSNTFIEAIIAKTKIISLNANPDNLFDDNILGSCVNNSLNQLFKTVISNLEDRKTNCNKYTEKRNAFIEQFSLEKNVNILEDTLLNIKHGVS